MHVGAIPLFVSRDRHLEVGNAARDPGQDPFRRMGVLDAGELAQSDRVCPRFFAAQKGSEPEGPPTVTSEGKVVASRTATWRGSARH
jgi:hypothetical protein